MMTSLDKILVVFFWILYEILSGSSIFAAKVLIGRNLGNKLEFLCSGVAVSQKTILTSGHCVSNNGEVSPNVLMIEGQVFNIDRVIKHYRYKPHLDYHNLAAVFFNSSNTPIETYRLPQLPNDLKNVKDAFIDVSSDGQSEMSVKLMDYEKCHEYYDADNRIRFGILDNELCTTNTVKYSTKLKILDGEPLFVKRAGTTELIGIKSFKTLDLPEVYTRLASYFDWITIVANIS